MTLLELNKLRNTLEKNLQNNVFVYADWMNLAQMFIDEGFTQAPKEIRKRAASLEREKSNGSV